MKKKMEKKELTTTLSSIQKYFFLLNGPNKHQLQPLRYTQMNKLHKIIMVVPLEIIFFFVFHFDFMRILLKCQVSYILFPLNQI